MRAPRWAGLLVAAMALSACESSERCSAADLSAPDREAAFAVVSSDYFSTAIALLDREGELVTEAWLDSGTVPPGVVAALSGDVVLPTTPIDECVLTIIDRYPTDMVTFLNLCATQGDDPLIRQVDVSEGFVSNPHDVLPLDGGLAMVSRHDPSPEGDRGSDLLLIEWRAGHVRSRIDLSALDTTIDGAHVYSRPSRMVRLRAGHASRAVVGLARMDRSFMAVGPGAVAVVDPMTGSVEPVFLPDLASCDEVDSVPEHPELAVVTCRGRTFSDEPGRRGTAGLAMLELREDGAVHVRSTWRTSDHRDGPAFNTWAVPLDSDHVVVTATGDLLAGIDDRVGVLGMSGDAPAAPLFDAQDAFVIGDGTFDASSELLLVPDAHLGRVRRFRRESGGLWSELPPVDTAGCRGLPPREIRPLQAAAPREP